MGDGLHFSHRRARAPEFSPSGSPGNKGRNVSWQSRPVVHFEQVVYLIHIVPHACMQSKPIYQLSNLTIMRTLATMLGLTNGRCPQRTQSVRPQPILAQKPTLSFPPTNKQTGIIFPHFLASSPMPLAPPFELDSV